MWGNVINTLVGLFGGLALSAWFWHWTMHRVVPQIRFSSKISKVPSGIADRFIYRVKILNPSKRRATIDLDMTFRLSYRGLPHRPSANVRHIQVPVKARIMHLPPGANRVISLELNSETLRGNEQDFASEVNSALTGGQGDVLEILLGQGDWAAIGLHILCYDEWSGARKYYRSPDYTKEDIASGRFSVDGLDVIGAAPGANSS